MQPHVLDSGRAKGLCLGFCSFQLAFQGITPCDYFVVADSTSILYSCHLFVVLTVFDSSDLSVVVILLLSDTIQQFFE